MNPWNTHKTVNQEEAIKLFNWALDGQKLGFYEIKVSGTNPTGTVTFTIKSIIDKKTKV